MKTMDAPEDRGPDRKAPDEQALLQDSKVFCMAPWSHLHVLPTGGIFPCCMSAHDPQNAVGSLRTGDSLLSAWNSPVMRNLRKRMLDGQPSQLCERCYKGEEVGQESWRTSQNRAMAHHFPTVLTTHPDGGLEALNLPYLDIRFSNVCNLKCRICTPKLSSRWYNDARALQWVSADEPALITATADPEDLWKQITPLVPLIERFHFAGGEPLLMEDHYRLLDMLRDRGMQDVQLSYNTNLSVLRYRHYDVLDSWKAFRKVYVQASLDGMGARGDYMRKGQDWDAIVSIRRRMIAECPHVEFCVLATVSSMNVLHMPEFYRYLVDSAFIRPGEMQLNILFEPEYFNIRGLPLSLKQRVAESYQAFLDGYVSTFGPEADGVRGHFRAVVQYMSAEDWDVRDAFRRHTADLDGLRHERFLDVFPELAELMLAGAPPAIADD